MFNHIKKGFQALGRFLFPPTNRDKGWLSWKLCPSIILLFTIFEIGLIVSIEVLLHLSRNNNGFVTVDIPNPNSVSNDFFKRSHWTQSYLWTTLPTFVITLYQLCWTSIFTEFASRQPSVEMAKTTGSTGKKTVLLDYLSYFSFVSWFYAFKNKHVVLGFTILVSFLAIALPSLMSNLFKPVAISHVSAANMSITTFFNETAVNSKTNYQTVFNIVSAARVYNANFPPWTTEEYAFPMFVPTRDGGFPSSGNSSVELMAYSGGLDCQEMTTYDQIITNENVFIFNTTDRGCPISVHIPVAAGATVYMKTDYIGDCSSATGLRRHVFVGAVLAPNSSSSAAQTLTNISFISCTMNYFQTRGVLLVSTTTKNETAPSIVSFEPSDDPQAWLPDFWSGLEFMIHQIDQFDPTGTYASNNLGLLILAYSERVVGLSHRLDTNALIRAIQDVYASILSVSGSIYLLQPLETPGDPVAGQIYTFINRLFVANSTARLMQGLLSALTVWTVLVMVYSFAKRSILREEPKGLLGAAEVVYGGDLGSIVAEYRNDEEELKETFEEFVKSHGYEDRVFRVSVDEGQRPIIRLVDLVD
ncbi:uncharacterized protein TRIVIDRAFT_60312 [Trichoderma virens Gv29-8]|uniref:Uncharacterized protein n=1 Tax=Hypocrea virens (strain Gv29-8 / FGSC 10586) TaxID=413071 RepID=G9MS00_HYPVG|nr:uncharacterized protein TRIVIDRAFT_60312 [Trichoderma virens Gv29-8]EHK22868.1 hypothetical protein TRIVIDRAFT_60312 [Trichoderma virens Gv29-8]UKZ47920.1 hypothetical protein TrVGV298_002154 [Trichoderma virens]UKZ74477.1 hypothetical protein TrVFT333_002145 [Trichoderma virens FT-333]